MIPQIVTLAAFLSLSLNSAPAPEAVPAEALGPVKYEVRYNLKGISTKVADATISLEKGRWNQQDALHSHAEITASSIFRLFMASEYIADAYLTTDSREPMYSVNPIRKGKKEGKFECRYDHKSMIISSEFAPPSEKPVLGTYPLDGLTMDLLSLVQYARFHDFPAGKPINIHLLMKGRSVAATLVNQGPDKEKFPGQATDRLFIKMIDTGLMENGSGNEITVWRSAESSHRILGLETSLSSGTMSVSIAE